MQQFICMCHLLWTMVFCLLDERINKMSINTPIWGWYKVIQQNPPRDFLDKKKYPSPWTFSLIEDQCESCQCYPSLHS